MQGHIVRLRMVKMKNNKTLVLCMLIFAVIAVFAVITITVTSTTLNSETAVAESVAAEGRDAVDDSDSGEGTSSAKGDKGTAETLIGQDLSRDQVEEALGEWNDFNMDGNGCERGVYAGRFYYDDFILYSRTYDLGKTFHIMSVNEQE